MQLDSDTHRTFFRGAVQKVKFYEFVPRLGLYNKWLSTQSGVKTHFLWVYGPTYDTFWTAPYGPV